MSKSIISKISIILSSIVYIGFFYFLNKYNILPQTMRFIILAIILILILGFAYLTFKKKNINKLVKTLFILLLLIVSLAEGIFISYANTSIKTVEKINQKKDLNKTQMSLVVLKNSSIDSIEQIGENQVAIARKMDKENIKQATEEFKREKKN